MPLFNSDTAQRIKAFLLLAGLVFSIVLGVAAPYELSQVYAVNAWPVQRAEIIHVELKTATSNPGAKSYWSYELLLTDTGEKVFTSDVRPGDLPLSALAWSTSSWDAARFHDGQAIDVYRSPEGGKVFLERGSYGFMSAVWAACIIFCAWFWRRAVRSRAART